MNKKTIIFWLIYSAVLIFLYILSATDLIIKENETKVYGVSVLVDGISGENLLNLKKGMDEASYEHNIDMRFPAVAENLTLEEKLEIAEDEIEAGIGAIIIGNKWKNEIAAEIKRRHQDFPVLILGRAKEENKGSVAVNYKEIVKILSDNIRAAESIENKIYILAESLEDEELKSFEQGLEEKFITLGYETGLLEGGRVKLEGELGSLDMRKVVFVAIDKDATSWLVKYIEDRSEKNAAKIYAVGATDYLLGKLEDGEIKGMAAWNEYDMGYLIVERLAKMLEKEKKDGQDTIQAFYITGEDLKNEDYIKILYPIGG